MSHCPCGVGSEGCQRRLAFGWAVMRKKTGNVVFSFTACPVCAKMLKEKYGYEAVHFDYH